MDAVHSLLKAIQAPYFTLSLYAPIAWSKSHSQPSPPQHRRTSSSWQIATFPAYLRDFIAQRQRCVLSLREKILTTAALASVHPGILCPPCSPASSLASSMNLSPDGQPSHSVESLIASQHASADHLLQGLFLYDAIQAKLASVAATEQDSDQKSHLSTLLSPLLESMSAQDLQRLLIAVRALHHTLRAHLHCVLNSEDDFDQDFEEADDIVEPSSAVDSGYDTELPAMSSFSPAFSPPYTKGKIKRSVTSDTSDLSSSKTFYSAADFKIDGWLRLGANSVLAILNMCSGACPFLEDADKRSSTLAVSLHATSSPIPFTERKPSNASLSSMGITISSEDKEMVRECLDRYVDTTACASRRNGSTIGSTSFNGHGCCGDEEAHSHEDGKCEWERVIEKVLAAKR